MLFGSVKLLLCFPFAGMLTIKNGIISGMEKNQQRALPSAAKAYCIGIVNGLWRYEEESRSDFSDWVTDAPGEYVDTIVEKWKKGNPDDTDIAEVMSVVNAGRA
jgi:hypothetical protein